VSHLKDTPPDFIVDRQFSVLKLLPCLVKLSLLVLLLVHLHASCDRLNGILLFQDVEDHDSIPFSEQSRGVNLKVCGTYVSLLVWYTD
jgi:hypothetical protein